MTGELTELTDAQLEALRGRVEDLQSRRLEEQVRRDAEARANAGAAEEAKGGDGRGHIRWEMINCGDCHKCHAGLRPHGPYWYQYRWKDGKLKGKYLGKRIPAAAASESHPEGSRPEDVYPASVARVQADNARQWAVLQEQRVEDGDRALAG